MVTDDNGDTQVSGKVIIVVNPVVDIANDTITLQAGTSSSDNLLTNDSFENSDRTITGVTQGTHGTVSIGSNGIVTYTPQPITSVLIPTNTPSPAAAERKSPP